MKFSFKSIIDLSNKLLICQAFGEAREVIDIEHILNNIVNMTGENQVENIELDVTMFSNHCANQEVSELMINIQENKWLSDIKIARIIEPGLNIHNLIETMAKKLSLPIKNFEIRSEAMLQLLFDKVRE